MENSKFLSFLNKLHLRWIQVQKSFKSRRDGLYLHIDFAILIPTLGVYIDGWFFSTSSNLQNLTLRSKFGSVIGSQSSWMTKRRPDVTNYLINKGLSCSHNNHGVFGLIPFSAQNSENQELYLKATLENGKNISTKLNALPIQNNAFSYIKRILSNWQIKPYHVREPLEKHIGITVEGIWKSRQKPDLKLTINNYGQQQQNPDVSIIVPLYGRVDFVKYQLALFANDSDFLHHELIYVLDDPRLETEFLSLCDQQHSMSQVPFKTLNLGTNLGYAGANNQGVKIAKGRLIILLNSDVMPKNSGWISSLVKKYDSLSNIGAVCPKLLYADNSIQHAGIRFSQYGPWENLWVNDHPRKGQPNFMESNILPQKHPALTGACLMVSRELYTKVGGLDEDYIVGDFEDSDLCLKFHKQGLNNYYVPEIELFHLERQSLHQDQNESQWHSARTLYNCWIYNQKWSNYIQEKDLGN